MKLQPHTSSNSDNAEQTQEARQFRSARKVNHILSSGSAVLDELAKSAIDQLDESYQVPNWVRGATHFNIKAPAILSDRLIRDSYLSPSERRLEQTIDALDLISSTTGKSVPAIGLMSSNAKRNHDCLIENRASKGQCRVSSLVGTSAEAGLQVAGGMLIASGIATLPEGGIGLAGLAAGSATITYAPTGGDTASKIYEQSAKQLAKWFDDEVAPTLNKLANNIAVEFNKSKKTFDDYKKLLADATSTYALSDDAQVILDTMAKCKVADIASGKNIVKFTLDNSAKEKLKNETKVACQKLDSEDFLQEKLNREVSSLKNVIKKAKNKRAQDKNASLESLLSRADIEKFCQSVHTTSSALMLASTLFPKSKKLAQVAQISGQVDQIAMGVMSCLQGNIMGGIGGCLGGIIGMVKLFKKKKSSGASFEKIMFGLLQQISQQIATLQEVMKEEFAEVKKQLSDNHREYLAQFSTLHEGQKRIEAKIDDLTKLSNRNVEDHKETHSKINALHRHINEYAKNQRREKWFKYIIEAEQDCESGINKEKFDKWSNKFMSSLEISANKFLNQVQGMSDDSINQLIDDKYDRAETYLPLLRAVIENRCDVGLSDELIDPIAMNRILKAYKDLIQRYQSTENNRQIFKKVRKDIKKCQKWIHDYEQFLDAILSPEQNVIQSLIESQTTEMGKYQKALVSAFKQKIKHCCYDKISSIKRKAQSELDQFKQQEIEFSSYDIWFRPILWRRHHQWRLDYAYQDESVWFKDYAKKFGGFHQTKGQRGDYISGMMPTQNNLKAQYLQQRHSDFLGQRNQHIESMKNHLDELSVKHIDNEFKENGKCQISWNFGADVFRISPTRQY